MEADAVIFSVFVVFAGAALMAALALFARQSMLVAYIVVGVLAGPSVFGLIENQKTIEGIGHVGIIFLLYLLGLNMHPQKLLQLLSETTLVTVLSASAFTATGFAIASLFGFPLLEALLIGATCMFSSTIIGLKLLPTTALHHRHVGEVMISVLLLQDLIAIVLLLLVESAASGGNPFGQAAWLALALAGLGLIAYLAQRFVLLALLARFDTIHEYVFLTAIGWCLGIAQLGHVLGLSYEMGAFVAGVALAASPISTFIAESLKPLRDFFLIMFFFALGADFPLHALTEVFLPAAVLAGAMLVIKPLVFEALLRWERESAKLSREIGFRLGQCSEFALLLAVLAAHAGVMSEQGSLVVQSATLLTFLVSSYVIVLLYPTPIAVSPRLRRD